MATSEMLYHTLQGIHKIGSPIIHSFKEDNLYKRTVYFPFRFAELDLNDQLYLRLINTITKFEGELVWCMYNYASDRNYVIEPLIFYAKRREIRKDNRKIELVDAFAKSELKELIKRAISDIPMLCEHIQSPR